MKVLWICNVPIPEAKEVMGDETQVRVSWLVGISQALRKKTDLSIAYISRERTEIATGEGAGVTFIAIPGRKAANQFDPSLEVELLEVYEKIKPDVIHVFGTEFPHTLSVINASRQSGMLDQTVISIQGLVSLCGTHYLASLPHWVCRFYTVRDLLRHCNIYGAKKEFEARGKYETRALKEARHVIGRTDWDKACTRMINPAICYHFNNEILRDSFYRNRWEYKSCEPYRIFMSQGGVPYKGFHFAIEALALLKQKYPKVSLYITERDFVHPKGLKEKVRLNSYQYYLKKLIRDYGVEENIHFLDTLNEEQMCEQYLKANAYILPSVIENSPNSLGEALLLGTPAVAADVGGVKNMMEHRKEGFVYPHDDPYMLAAYLEEIFLMREAAEELSEAAHAHAARIFDVTKNIEQLEEIYRSMKDGAH